MYFESHFGGHRMEIGARLSPADAHSHIALPAGSRLVLTGGMSNVC